MPLAAFARRHLDSLVASALFCGYLALLLGSAAPLGFTRDEGFYFVAARSYEKWFSLLWSDPSLALSQAMRDRFWGVNHEHPSLIKSLFALSHHFLGGLFAEPSTSFRLPGMALSSLGVAVIYRWGQQLCGRSAGLVAALSFAFMPRVFFHAHLACFDLPVTALWLVTSYLYWRSLAQQQWGRAHVAVGVMFGLLLDTKHNAWLMPPALLLHFALTQGPLLLRELRTGKPWWQRVPRAWLSMALLGPLVMYGLWPWLWHDTLPRLREYVTFHTAHEYYNMEFLGRTYWQPPFPRGYAQLMTLATVPAVTLALALAGVLTFLRAQWSEPARAAYWLWAVSILISYAPWLSSSTPIFGGTKHWLPAYPFLALFAGLGFARVLETVRAAWPRLAQPVALAACVVLGPLVMTLHSHPFGLSAYTPLVGGPPGAASLGLNRTFWGYTTQSLAPFINQRAPRRSAVYVHDTALASFAMFQEDGRLRPDLRGTLDIAASAIALYHHEPHMSRVEHQIWLDYSTLEPSAIAAFDGVPIAWSYARPPVHVNVPVPVPDGP